MRLINTKTLELHEFFDNDIPKYAILSHTWNRDEMTYQDMQKLDPQTQGTAGYIKVAGCCKLAHDEGNRYVWIDTCCIDKTSSAELSEAINSMFRWYQNAEICFVYLADVPFEDPYSESFMASRWFARGWTLQELIAPTNVAFYSKSWTFVGTKLSLRQKIFRITGIDIRVLEGAALNNICVGKKMYWASRRVTTRREDEAYCLMGLFNVNMPLLYGEGEKAFIRLQEEIMRNVHDHTLFAWFLSTSGYRSRVGLLARSLREFRWSRNVILLPNQEAEPYELTSRGVRMKLPWYTDGDWSYAALDCALRVDDSLKRFWICLSRQRSPGARENYFTRICESQERAKLCNSKNCEKLTESNNIALLYIESYVDTKEATRNGVEFLVQPRLSNTGYCVASMYPSFAWDNIDNMDSTFSISTVSLTRLNESRAITGAEMSPEKAVMGALMFQNHDDTTKCLALLLGTQMHAATHLRSLLFEFRDVDATAISTFGDEELNFTEEGLRDGIWKDDILWYVDVDNSIKRPKPSGTYVVRVFAQREDPS
ncbi:MAG: hypothetical protein Q9160_004026 [Pyrenula sp. 1 TL-2023]